VSSTTSGRPTAAPPIARAGNAAAASASPAPAASPARRPAVRGVVDEVDPSPPASASASARAVATGRRVEEGDARRDLAGIAERTRAEKGANVDAATTLIVFRSLPPRADDDDEQ
jgi:hypothetical protein